MKWKIEYYFKNGDIIKKEFLGYYMAELWKLPYKTEELAKIELTNLEDPDSTFRRGGPTLEILF